MLFRYNVDDISPAAALTFGPRQVPLSVLDTAPVPDNGDPASALRATIDLARHAERLGYHRYWVAEHHNMPGIASSTPPVLISHIAEATSTMRVGSGGVMLPNHTSLVVAEQFGMLEALHPGRIDLGIGRAPGTDQLTAAALRRSPDGLTADEFPEQLVELAGFFTGRWPDGHPFARITAMPGRGYFPAVWLLGSSGYSAQVAACSACRSPSRTTSARPTPCPPWPCTASGSARPTFSRSPTPWSPPRSSAPRRTSRPASWPAPAPCRSCACARAIPAPCPPASRGRLRVLEVERAFIDDRQATQIIGSPQTVRAGVASLLDATVADELMITTMTYDPADRLRSFELVADLARTPAPEPLQPTT